MFRAQVHLGSELCPLPHGRDSWWPAMDITTHCCAGGLDLTQLELLMKELGHPMETGAVQAVFNEYDLDRYAVPACGIRAINLLLGPYPVLPQAAALTSVPNVVGRSGRIEFGVKRPDPTTSALR